MGWADIGCLKRCEKADRHLASMYPIAILCSYSISVQPAELVLEVSAQDRPGIVVNKPLGKTK